MNKTMYVLERDGIKKNIIPLLIFPKNEKNYLVYKEEKNRGYYMIGEMNNGELVPIDSNMIKDMDEIVNNLISELMITIKSE